MTFLNGSTMTLSCGYDKLGDLVSIFKSCDIIKILMAKADFLKKRAEEFLKTADYHLREKIYSLAAFDLEQTLQLYLKYYIFLKLADFPKTHDLIELLKGIGRVYKKETAIEKILKEKPNLISDLNQAYLTSRYLPVEFSKQQVENMKEFVKEIIKFLKSYE